MQTECTTDKTLIQKCVLILVTPCFERNSGNLDRYLFCHLHADCDKCPSGVTNICLIQMHTKSLIIIGTTMKTCRFDYTLAISVHQYIFSHIFHRKHFIWLAWKSLWNENGVEWSRVKISSLKVSLSGQNNQMQEMIWLCLTFDFCSWRSHSRSTWGSQTRTSCRGDWLK